MPLWVTQTLSSNQYLDVLGNKDLFLNTISWLAERSDMVTIRPKTSPTSVSMLFLTEGEDRLLLWSAVIIEPALVLAGRYRRGAVAEALQEMKVQRILILAVVFCALLGYVLLAESPAPRKSKPAAEQLVKIFPVPESAIQSIEIRKGPAQVTLIRRDKLWELSAPVRAELSQEQVESLLSTITGLVRIEVVSEGTEELRQYGLEHPAMSITLSTAGTSPVTLLVGSDCPTGVSMYAMIQGTKDVIQVGTLLRFSINSFLDLYARPAS